MMRMWIIWACLLSPFSTADQPISVSIAADNNYPPYSYLDNGKMSGIYTDIISEISKKMTNYNISIMPLPWKRALLNVQQGEIPFIYPPYFRPKERPYLKYSSPLLTERLVMFCHRDVMEKIPRQRFPEDYKGLSIARNLGFLVGEHILKANEDGIIKLIETTDAQAALFRIYSRRLDCYINDRLSVLFELKKLAMKETLDQNQLIEAVVFSKEDAFLATHQNSVHFPFAAAFLHEFNQHLQTMQTHGDIQRIIERYQSFNRPPRTDKKCK